MTKTISITQEILDELDTGQHLVSATATNESGFSSTANALFTKRGLFSIVVPDLGEYNSAFSFDIELRDVNGTANVLGYIDGAKFYQLNFAASGEYEVTVSNNVLFALGGGTHTLTINGNDEQGMTATVSKTFTKTMTVPQVSFATNLGDKFGAFPVTYAIKNVQSEHPSLVAYMDSVGAGNIIYELADAAVSNTFTVDAETFSALANGSHTIILVVTNTAGSTTKNASFNKAVQDDTFTGLKLGYSDDTWDGTVTENRIYSEQTVTYQGQSYKSYQDETPYDTEGEPVTGALLAAFSRGVQNANASNTVSNSDGSMTETSANGTSILTVSADGYIEVFTDKDGNTLTKQTFFNSDGSIAESTTYQKRSN